MDHFVLVRPEHINQHGYLFGGQLLLWIDEISWMTASLDFPGYKLVTQAMRESIFKKPVPLGAILRFNAVPESQGKTSITYCVNVYVEKENVNPKIHFFTTTITFTAVDDQGNKTELPKITHYQSLNK